MMRPRRIVRPPRKRKRGIQRPGPGRERGYIRGSLVRLVLSHAADEGNEEDTDEGGR